jgi:hypothetical protein
MSGKDRVADFERARRAARTWLDNLEVDAAELSRHNVKGVKKLGEILYVYEVLYRHSDDQAERAGILRRVEKLAEQTRRDQYHAIMRGSDREFSGNSMSYLRVMYLLERFGLDTREYRRHLNSIKPRMDAHLARRGKWQRAIFAEYYDRLDLKKPPVLRRAPSKSVVLAKRKPLEDCSKNAAYRLTHEVFVAYDYGMQRTQQRLSSEDIAYLRGILPQLLDQSIAADNPDLAAELLCSMTYLGQHDDPVFRRGIDFLLDSQNPDGSWGDYEHLRSDLGQYADQGVYLHTTVAVMCALVEVFQGNWPTVK